MKKKILLFSLLFGLLNSVKAQDGQLDPSFGKGGIVVTDVGAYDTSAIPSLAGEQVLLNDDGSMYFLSGDIGYGLRSVTKKNKDGIADVSYGKNGYSTPVRLQFKAAAILQKDGKLLLSGLIQTKDATTRYHSVVYRLNVNGSLDSSFNGKGVKASALVTNTEETPVATQADGKIVVGGSVIFNNTNRYLLYRLNIDGSEDPSFTQIGKLADSLQNYKSIAIQSDGKIVAAGYKTNLSLHNVFTLSRHNTNGSIDTSFKATGIPTQTSQSSLVKGAFEMGHTIKILIDEDQNILVAGTVTNIFGANSNFGIARFKKDGSFDTLIITDIAGTNDLLLSATIGNNGSIILSGYSQYGNDFSYSIVNFNKDLSYNTNFSGDGKLFTGLNGFLKSANSVAVQKDGKIVVLGYIEQNYTKVAALRINSNGSIDESFAVNGKLIETFLHSTTNYESIAIQNDGKILAGGYASNGKNINYALVRYNKNGSLDSSFSTDGKVMKDFGSGGSENIRTIAVQKDGKIIVGGNGGDSLSIVRYNTNGSLDKSYGINGINQNKPGENSLFTIKIQKDGRLIAGGTSLSRYINNSFDTSFNGIGWLPFPLQNNYQFICEDLAIQKDEKIIILGNLLNFPQFPILARYQTNGKIDCTFGKNGFVLNYSDSRETATSVYIQNDGKILIGGSFRDLSNPGVYTFSISRLNQNGSRDSSFNGGKILHPATAGQDIGSIIKVQTDGKIIMTGNTFIDGQSLFKIARFNPDGTSDLTFNNTGNITSYVGGEDASIYGAEITGNSLYVVGTANYPGNSAVVAKYRLTSAPEILPLKINFEGQVQNNKTALQWQVENQQKIKYFTVEKSRDSVKFLVIENIAAKNNNLIAAYTTVDNTPFTGNNFYRLKLKNTDSSVTYSSIVNVNFINTNINLKISPNPATSRLIVSTHGENEKATIKIFDIFGRKFKELKVLINGNTVIPVDINALPKGVYTLQLLKKSATETSTFVKE